MREKTSMNRNVLLVSLLSLLVSISLAPSAYAGNYAYCEFVGVRRTSDSPAPPQYFSDVFLWANSPGKGYDPQKRFVEYVRSSYPVFSDTQAQYVSKCLFQGNTEDKARDARSKEMKYHSYSGPIVETRWKMPAE